MADIFDEVEDDLKRDRMQLLWSKYGKYVIVAAVLVIAGVAGRQGYEYWNESRKVSSASAYNLALKEEDLVSALSEKITGFNQGYAMLAEFRTAAEYAKRKDLGASEAAYLALYANPKISRLYQEAALLMSVMNAPTSRSVSELEDRLLRLEGAAGPWQAMAIEQAAGLALRSGDRATALLKYESLAGMDSIPVGMRQRARQMIQILKQ
mgnify:CR=1 FL=1